jgi:hypothetical protein
MKAKITAATQSTDVTTPIVRALRMELLKVRQHFYKFGVTRRVNKTTVYGSLRNAVDTGRLMKHIRVKRNGNSWEFIFDTDYATLVFNQRPELTKELEDVITKAFGQALATAVVLEELDWWR